MWHPIIEEKTLQWSKFCWVLLLIHKQSVLSIPATIATFAIWNCATSSLRFAVKGQTHTYVYVCCSFLINWNSLYCDCHIPYFKLLQNFLMVCGLQYYTSYFDCYLLLWGGSSNIWYSCLLTLAAVISPALLWRGRDTQTFRSPKLRLAGRVRPAKCCLHGLIFYLCFPYQGSGSWISVCPVLQVEQLLQGQEDSQGNINYENFVHLIMQGWARSAMYLSQSLSSH